MTPPLRLPKQVSPSLGANAPPRWLAYRHAASIGGALTLVAARQRTGAAAEANARRGELRRRERNMVLLESIDETIDPALIVEIAKAIQLSCRCDNRSHATRDDHYVLMANLNAASHRRTLDHEQDPFERRHHTRV